MKRYYYAPYDDPKMVGFVERIVEEKNEFGRTNVHINLNEEIHIAAEHTTKKPLKCLAGNSRLYVCVHGGNGMFGWKKGGVTTKVTPSDFCNDLIDRGLKNKAIELRLWACNAANSSGVANSIGQQLKTHLSSHGLRAITVVAYTSSVDSTELAISRDDTGGVDLEGRKLIIDNDVRRAVVRGDKVFLRGKNKSYYKKLLNFFS